MIRDVASHIELLRLVGEGGGGDVITQPIRDAALSIVVGFDMLPVPVFVLEEACREAKLQRIAAAIKQGDAALGVRGDGHVAAVLWQYLSEPIRRELYGADPERRRRVIEAMNTLRAKWGAGVAT